MNRTLLSILSSGVALTVVAATGTGRIAVSGENVSMNGDKIDVRLDLVLDSLRLGSNNQLYISPVITDNGSNSTVLPAVLVNGRNMQFAIDRHVMKAANDRYPEIFTSVKRNNGKPQSVTYIASAGLQPWMLTNNAVLTLSVDTCGCGVMTGGGLYPGVSELPLELNPADKMERMLITPDIVASPVSIHEGKARVQFEVDRTELHAEPYVCRSEQRIDNRRELQVIADSINYALTDPNVEIAGITICGYASPESPYEHNDMLATGRSKALAEYIADHFNLPREVCIYDAVPENWKEFRELVEASDEITEQQRADLLALIDAPAFGPSDYDAKEKTLKTDPRFAKLYRSLILPVWFPKLRATKFEIKTRLKPLDDQKLAEVILTSPEKMSLNQMYRVANLYPKGSEEFNRAIKIALAFFPDDPVANLNAAVAAIDNGDLDTAERLLEKAGDSVEAENARGILATYRDDFDAAARHFERAGSTSNLKRL